MDKDTLTARSLEPRSGAATLGLGWLIAITLCGGASLFIGLGFTLAWRIQRRDSPITVTRTVAPLPYEASGLTAFLSLKPSMSTTRLTKRRLHATPSEAKLSSSFSSRFSSRMSLKRIPSVPVLPPLPSYSTFRLFNPSRSYYRRSRNWLDDDSLHGPTVNKGAQDGWVTRDSWIGPVPTLPNLDEAERGVIDEDLLPRPEMAALRQQDEKDMHDVGLAQSQPPPPPPHLYGMQKDKSQGQMRQPAAAYLKRANTTEADLRDILRSTEQRLRDGRSRSPNKRPQVSPSKSNGTPGRRSMRTSSSQGSVRGRYGGSPAKRSGGLSASNSWSKNREDSATSINSAADSLIAHATEELQLPGGMGSPSRLRGREWLPGDDQILQLTAPSPESHTPQQSPSRSPQRSPQRSQRRRSNDSDASSSLSTLYSVGDDEVDLPTLRNEYNDPFVERNGSNRKTWESESHTGGQKALRRTMTISSDTLSRHVDKSTMPSLYQPLTTQRLSAHTADNVAQDAKTFSVVLQPPTPRGSEHVRPKSGTAEVTHMMIATDSSGSSFETLSVHDSDVSDLSGDATPKTYSPPSDHAKTDSCRASRNGDHSPPASPMTPTRDGQASDASSSPYSDYDVISMMLRNASPKRGRPHVPHITAPDGSILRTPLSPPPKSAARKSSNSSSIYAAEVGSGGDLARMATTRSFKALSVGNSVAELRRMNSIVSTFSNTSLSTVMGERDSPGLPDLADGRMPSLKATRKPVQMGSKHYLNISKGVHAKSHSTGQPYVQPKNPRRNLGSLRQNKADSPKAVAAVADQGKENEGVPVRRTSRSEGSPGLRDSPRGANQARDTASVPTMQPLSQPPRKAVRTLVSDIVARERRTEDKRTSADSLGMYDKDGFLIPSPDRETHKKTLRML